jgi:hypothetical protein
MDVVINSNDVVKGDKNMNLSMDMDKDTKDKNMNMDIDQNTMGTN